MDLHTIRFQYDSSYVITGCFFRHAARLSTDVKQRRQPYGFLGFLCQPFVMTFFACNQVCLSLAINNSKKEIPNSKSYLLEKKNKPVTFLVTCCIFNGSDFLQTVNILQNKQLKMLESK